LKEYAFFDIINIGVTVISILKFPWGAAYHFYITGCRHNWIKIGLHKKYTDPVTKCLVLSVTKLWVCSSIPIHLIKHTYTLFIWFKYGCSKISSVYNVFKVSVCISQQHIYVVTNRIIGQEIVASHLGIRISKTHNFFFLMIKPEFISNPKGTSLAKFT
jgi:hypothetical protein